MKLPKLPHHPENNTCKWTELELIAIAAYGKACAEAMRKACSAYLNEAYGLLGAAGRVMEVKIEI